MVLSLSRTYEELKLLNLFVSYFTPIKFIAYLWGIETFVLVSFFPFFPNSLSRTYEELKPESPNHRITEFIAYLWGIETRITESLNHRVYRVPMRNWNRIYYLYYFLVSISLSRTYEELKPIMRSVCLFMTMGLSRTYEELKHFTTLLPSI